MVQSLFSILQQNGFRNVAIVLCVVSVMGLIFLLLDWLGRK